MRIKDASVECSFNPVLTALLFALDIESRALGSELVLTSGSELTAKHSVTSLHYSGNAADIRIWEVKVPPEKYLAALQLVAAAFCRTRKIPTNWIELILEKDHIHIEYQPKRPA